MAEKKQLGMQIAVLDRGFVYAGKVSIEGDMLTIEDAKNVRRWGTTKGLGQLAADGPTANTVLDPAGKVMAPIKSVVHLVECKREW